PVPARAARALRRVGAADQGRPAQAEGHAGGDGRLGHAAQGVDERLSSSFFGAPPPVATITDAGPALVSSIRRASPPASTTRWSPPAVTMLCAATPVPASGAPGLTTIAPPANSAYCHASPGNAVTTCAAPIAVGAA